MRCLAVSLMVLATVGVGVASPAPPITSTPSNLPKIVHCCRVVVIRTPSGPQFVPVPIAAPAPAPIIMAPPVRDTPVTDPAVLALLHQILNNQTQILSQLAKIQAAPGGCGPGGVIVVPADGGGPVVPIPSMPPGLTPPPGVPPGITLPPGGTPGITPPPGGTPGITPPPGGTPGLTPPPGGMPGLTPPPGGIPKGLPSMPPAADPISAGPGTFQRFSYIRYTVYQPQQRRYYYVYVPQRVSSTPSKSAPKTPASSTFTPTLKGR